MKLPLRSPILKYQRDTYVDRDQGAEDVLAEAHGEAGASDWGGEVIDCGVGYSQWGFSPRAERLVRQLDLTTISAYPEPDHDSVLKPAILNRFRAAGLSNRELFLGHGSFNLNERIIHKFIEATTMVGVGPQFTEIPSEFIAAGGRYHPVPLTTPEYSLPVAEIEAALASEPVSAVFVDNPNNPLGKAFDLEVMERLARACAHHGAVLLVDEAWGDFLEVSHSSVNLVAAHDNIVVVRSFSKALGLAGERVGYMFMSPSLARFYRQIDVPFEPGVLGAVLARATLGDEDFTSEIRARSAAVKATIVGALETAGLTVLPTHPNVSIMAVHAPGRDIVADFRSRGVKVEAGSAFVRSHPDWDDSYCRLRIVHERMVTELCDRVRSMG